MKKRLKSNPASAKRKRRTWDLRLSGDFLDKIPWLTIPWIAFAALAVFGLWPIMVLVPTMWHCNFGRMLTWNMELLDNSLFPFVCFCSLAVYFLAIGKALREKRRLSEIFRRNPTFLAFLALVAWMIANMWLVNGVTYVLTQPEGLKHETFLLHLEYFLCFLPLGLFLRAPRLKLWLLRGLTIVSVILASCAFYLHDNLIASQYYYDWAPSYATIFTNPNYYGYFLSVFVSLSAALFVCAESRRWRWFYAAALVLNTVVLSFNRTRGAWVAGLCACAFLVVASRIRDGKFRILPLAALGLFVSVLCLTGLLNGKLISGLGQVTGDIAALVSDPESARATQAGSGRMEIWKHCLKLIRDNPLSGIGFEGIHVRQLAYVGNGRPHNEVMQYALFYGIPGAILYVLACAGVYVRAWKRGTRLDSLTLAALTAATGYLAGSMFGLTVYNTAPYLFIMLGLGYALEETETPSATDEEPESA